MNWQRIATIVVFALAVAYVAAALLLQRSLLFPAPPVRPSVVPPPEATRVQLMTRAGAVEAWYLPPRDGAAAPAPVIVFFHGNAELIDFVAFDFTVPRRWGMGVLAVEYPGYGRSEGSPSQATIASTATAAFDWLSAQSFVDRTRIVAYGRSLGGGAASILAKQRTPAALVLESTFTSVKTFARRFWVPEFAVLDAFDNLTAVSNYAGPLLVLHGANDQLIAPEHARQLAAASRRSELHLLPCGHNDCDRPWAVVKTFLEANALLRP